jgi:hypothetical protein
LPSSPARNAMASSGPRSAPPAPSTRRATSDR